MAKQWYQRRVLFFFFFFFFFFSPLAKMDARFLAYVAKRQGTPNATSPATVATPPPTTVATPPPTTVATPTHTALRDPNSVSPSIPPPAKTPPVIAPTATPSVQTARATATDTPPKSTYTLLFTPLPSGSVPVSSVRLFEPACAKPSSAAAEQIVRNSKPLGSAPDDRAIADYRSSILARPSKITHMLLPPIFVFPGNCTIKEGEKKVSSGFPVLFDMGLRFYSKENMEGTVVWSLPIGSHSKLSLIETSGTILINSYKLEGFKGDTRFYHRLVSVCDVSYQVEVRKLLLEVCNLSTVSSTAIPPQLVTDWKDIGGGGCGVVFRCKIAALDVACKTMKSGLSSSSVKERIALARELYLFHYLRDTPSVLRFIGYCLVPPSSWPTVAPHIEAARFPEESLCW
eukprot:TRINITY_DN1944_c0_g1_i5.p1 TRINITY_DN1944_c0_g1~~TRINITY_DN1944_c0_g1_i5.p1  ORF type:complete len:401 (-),score=52.19 TRINITY_DN1944_c0_g1_i5:709-1911(-)